MSIVVAIQEQVVVSNAVVNEKNSLVITLTQGVEVDAFEAMNSGSSMSAESVNIMLFPTDNKWYGKEGSADELVRKFRQLTAKLAESIKIQQPTIKWNMFEGTGITGAADIKTKITSLEVCEKIGLNIYNQYVAMVTSSDKTKLCRMKLVRQSAAKHFPTLPDTLFFKKDSNEEYTIIFTEDACIPKEQSKVKYSKSEESKGLHIADKVVADAAPTDALPFEL